LKKGGQSIAGAASTMLVKEGHFFFYEEKVVPSRRLVQGVFVWGKRKGKGGGLSDEKVSGDERALDLAGVSCEMRKGLRSWPQKGRKKDAAQQKSFRAKE